MKGPDTPNYIAIEGPIGVGKSSLTLKLSSHFGAQTIMEKVEENPFLAGFYKDRRQCAFQAQMFFLLSRHKQLLEANRVDLFQQMVVADYVLEKDRLFALINRLPACGVCVILNRFLGVNYL